MKQLLVDKAIEYINNPTVGQIRVLEYGGEIPTCSCVTADLYSLAKPRNRRKMKMYLLYAIIEQGTLAFINWLQQKGLLKDRRRCSSRGCRSVMELRETSEGTDGYLWRCPLRGCGKRCSLRKGTFFENSNLSMGEILSLVYCWAVGMTMSTTATVMELSHHTVIDWFNCLREECTAKLLRLSREDRMLGGAGHIVEIDESLLIKRKYNRGRRRHQHQQWVFGMYDRRTGNGIIQFVHRRDEATLLPLIQQYVLPGSTIYTDGWAAYNNLSNHGYVHGVVVHEENFVDPETGVHTQGIEAYWSRAKRKIREVYGSTLPLLPSYIDEYMWRERYGFHSAEAFHNIMEHIAEHY